MRIDNKAYAKAYKEVLEIIKYFPEEEYNKIPQEKIEFFKQNMDKHYYFQINPNIDLSEQNISKEANAIIVNLYFDYFATDIQREKINKLLAQNKKKLEEYFSQHNIAIEKIKIKETKKEKFCIDISAE